MQCVSLILTGMAVSMLIIFAFQAKATSVVKQDNTLIFSHQGEIQKLQIPPDLEAAESYSIRVLPKKTKITSSSHSSSSVGGGMGGGITNSSPNHSRFPKEKPRLSSLIYRANKLFQKRKLEEAMEVLETAETMAPNNPKVKAMKGSLFFLMGWKNYAKQYWEESLSLNPEQPKVRTYLKNLNPKSAQPKRRAQR